MARKQRDYKAEYAAAKQRATRLGYKSEREYKQVRKALQLPRNASPAPRRIVETVSPNITVKPSRITRLRREAREWSKKHSHTPNSKYRESLTDDQLIRYHRAFVEPLPGEGKSKSKRREKLKRIREYLVPELLDETEWTGKYVPQA